MLGRKWNEAWCIARASTIRLGREHRDAARLAELVDVRGNRHALPGESFARRELLERDVFDVVARRLVGFDVPTRDGSEQHDEKRQGPHAACVARNAKRHFQKRTRYEWSF